VRRWSLWLGAEYLAFTRILSPDRPAQSASLYILIYLYIYVCGLLLPTLKQCPVSTTHQRPTLRIPPRYTNKNPALSITLVTLCKTFRYLALIHESNVFSKHSRSCLCSLRKTQTPLPFRSSSVSYLPTPLIFPVTGYFLAQTHVLFWNYRNIKLKNADL
jgi:hypothetical protein